MPSLSSSSLMNVYTLRLEWLLLYIILFGTTFAQLSEDFYSTSCPQALSIIESEVKSAISKEARMGASLLRLHFHDCFASLGGPNWRVPLGRRDSRKSHGLMADFLAAILAGGLKTQIPAFALKGFSKDDFVALTGGHTVGMAKCGLYKKRIYDGNANIDPDFAKALQEKCPLDGGDENMSPIDTTTPFVFDNAYFTNLINKKGLLDSDQQLYTGKNGTTDDIVASYSSNKEKFFDAFSKAIVKMGKLDIKTGKSGEVRTKCRKVNSE